MIYGKEYLRGHESSGIKPGDKVILTKTLRAGKGWGNREYIWIKNKDFLLGKELTILSDRKEGGFEIKCRDKNGKSHDWHFPYFVLSKIIPVEVKKRKIKISGEEMYLPECIISRIT